MTSTKAISGMRDRRETIFVFPTAAAPASSNASHASAMRPKPGTPRGIDKGWDYMPGDSGSDTVRQIAAKTQQWEYVLAKAYMQGVPDSVRDALAVAYRNLPSVADDVRRVPSFYTVLRNESGLYINRYQF